MELYVSGWSSSTCHRSSGRQHSELPVPDNLLPLPIPDFERPIRLFTQRLKRLKDILLLSALCPNSTANTNCPVQICLGKRDIVPCGQPCVERPVECVELFKVEDRGRRWGRGLKSEHAQRETGRRDEPKVNGLLDQRDKGVATLDRLRLRSHMVCGTRSGMYS